jgi:phosphoglycerol transferase
LELHGGKFWIAIGIGLLTGVQNVYYTSVFLQFLGFAAVTQAIRRQPGTKIFAPILVGTVSVCGFVLMNLDTFSYQATHGVNLQAAARTYQGVERYALKPLDLLIPPPDHRSSVARKIAWDYTYAEAKKVYITGEPFSQYLGLFGVSSLLYLGIVSVVRLNRWPPQPMPGHTAQILWIVLYSVIGGINGLLGQVGINLFRCTNRFSIWILAITLLFAARQLSRLSRFWPPALITCLSALLLTLVLWDQLPPTTTQSDLSSIAAMISSDRAFTNDLEKALPPGALVFQLPAMKFPESWPIVQMGDYEHFRPYLYSKDLHFSYGDDKGRGRDDWQFAVEHLPPAEMIAALEKYGFAAIYINRRGYEDGGRKLIEGLQGAGRQKLIESPAHDLVSVLLAPSQNPIMPETPPQFVHGWYTEEGDAKDQTWHCSSGDAEVILHSNLLVPRKVQVEFELAAPSTRTVELWAKGALVYSSPTLNANKVPHSMILELPPGATTLTFRTQPPVIFPGNADTRLLGFVLYNLRVTNVDR